MKSIGSRRALDAASGIWRQSLAGRFFRLLSPDALFHALVTTAGYLLLATVGLIFVFMFSQAQPLFREYSLWGFLTGSSWLSTASPPVFGILPFVLGSAFIVGWALVVGVPLGFAVAVYQAELASPVVRRLAGPLIGMLAGIPSVVYGILGLLIVAPYVARVFSLPTGLTGLTAGTVLGIMIVPTVATIAEEALSSVPKEYREAALSLGATPFQAFWTVVVPAASSGVTAGVLLAMGRALGETMTVLIVAGGRLAVPHSLLMPMRTMTATLAAEINNTAQFGSHYQALFALGTVLFLMTLAITVGTDIMLQRSRKGAGHH